MLQLLDIYNFYSVVLFLLNIKDLSSSSTTSVSLFGFSVQFLPHLHKVFKPLSTLNCSVSLAIQHCLVMLIAQDLHKTGGFQTTKRMFPREQEPAAELNSSMCVSTGGTRVYI